MNRGYIYLIFSVLVAVLSFYAPRILQIILIWISLSSLYYATAYFANFGEMLFKNQGGRLPFYIKMAIFPVLLGATVFNLVARSKDIVPPLQKVGDGLWLSRRLVFTDLKVLKESPVNAVLDVTAEFDAIETQFLDKEVEYLNIPVMDHHSPRKSQLEMAVRWIDTQRKNGKEVLIHCALGQGRSVTVLLAYLKFLNPQATYQDLIDEVRKIRPNVKPNTRQFASLNSFGIAMEKKSDELHIIYNPASGGASEEKLDKIRELLGSFFDMSFHQISENESANGIAAKLINSGKKFIVAAGGDGTIGKVAQALVHTDALLGIIPLGTSNAFASSLYGDGIRLKPIETACAIITSGKTSKIDIAKANDCYMLLLAGAGLERGMTELAEGDLKDEWGAFGYVIAGLRHVENTGLFDAKLTVDGQTHTFQTGSVTIANTAPRTSIFAQGGEEPAPDDGLLDVTVIVNVENKLQAAETLVQLLNEKPAENSEYVKHFRGKTVKLETFPTQKLVVDGEICDDTPVTVQVLEKALNVCGN
ncbi:MAG: diacylglycerol kinase family protein [Bacteroidia bacterium]|nr:diacylglycerol kinase family protein [Bacteroidia bacterium]